METAGADWHPRSVKSFPFLALLLLALLAPRAVAAAPPEAAPTLAPGTWLGSPPLSLAELHGQVVLVEFWTYLCGNCRNVEPHVRAWHDRFASRGLVVIGVHTPELEVERDLEHVKRYVAEHRITWPVLVDNELGTWRAFDNRYWPAWYLIDRQGRIRHEHVGEGGYDETEAWIERLLAEPPGVPASAAQRPSS